MKTLTALRSALFFAWFVGVSVVLHILALPTLLMPARAIQATARLWARALLFGLKIFAGLGYEVRGAIPRNGAFVASKHMSMWDTLALYVLLDKPTAVLKRELLSIPFYGWYLKKAGVIAIDRAGRASAMRKMVADARAMAAAGRAILIFPEGTRKKPGAAPDYKPGVAGLYSQLGLACHPVALNSGLYWTGPGGFLKKPGTVVVEFLPPIPPGLKRAEFMTALESGIENATARLVVEGRANLTARGLG